MAFNMYPSTLDNPLSVPPNTANPPIAFTEHIGPGEGDVHFFSDVMYIRVAMLNPASPCGPPPLSGDLTVSLIVDGGTPVVIPQWTTTASIYNSGNATHIADVSYDIEPNGVFLIYVIFQDTGPVHNWQIQIRNNHLADTREFTWVSADSIAETAQPWIDVSSTTSPAGELNYDTLIGAQILVNQTENHTLQIANKGTGPLTVTDAPGQIGASDFEIIPVPPGPINPNSCGDMVIAFNAPSAAGESVEAFSVGSDDGSALNDPLTFHNREVTLIGTSGKLEVMFLLDTSGSMSWEPAGNSPPANPNESRWGRLKSAAKASLALLGDYADGAGRFGISMFPDITTMPPPSISSADFYPPADINPANIGDADASLDDHTPDTGWTPMGEGIERVIGAAGPGNFEGTPDAVQFNRRWMILMTDGAHNQGPPDPSDFFKTAEGDGGCPDPGSAAAGRSFVDKGVRVVTVAYGDDAGNDVDHDLLNTLACKSDGLALDAGVNDLDPIDPLAKQIRAAVIEGLNLTVASDPVGYLTKSSPEKRAQIQVTPYDSKATFVVDWNTFDEDLVDVQLLTPDCELITPQTAKNDPNIAYHSHPRYKIYTIGEAYLRNAADPDQPRYGAWTLIISSDRIEKSEAYQYEVLMASRLKLKLDFDKSVYYAGDAVALTAAVTLDGKPVSGAAATLHASAPGNSAVNWLAGAEVTAGEYRKAAERFREADITSLGIKSFALREKGLRFNGFRHSHTIPMAEDGETGFYKAIFGDTSVTGGYRFYVTVTGQTEEGVAFRREIQRQERIGVRPDPKFTLFDINYTRLFDDQRPAYIADIRVWPRDRFGNAVLVDTQINSSVQLTARGGEFTGPLAGSLDGSYSRKLRYSAKTRPLIGLKVSGSEILQRYETAPLDDLVWADRLFDFRPGREAEEGANRHSEPKTALGDVTAKKPDAFLSLGGFGTVAVGVKDRIIEARGDDDVIVFVKPDEELRPYAVEALVSEMVPESRQKWAVLGRSEGITQSFSLKRAGLPSAAAIRILDTGGRILTRSFKPSPTPGISITGVGFGRSALTSEHWLGGIHISRIDGIGNKYVDTLKFEGVETIADLADMNPMKLEGALPLMRMVELRTKARLALRTAAAIEPAPGLEKNTVWEILTTPHKKLAAVFGVTFEQVARLYEQVSALQLSLDNSYLKELTIGELARRR